MAKNIFINIPIAKSFWSMKAKYQIVCVTDREAIPSEKGDININSFNKVNSLIAQIFIIASVY